VRFVVRGVQVDTIPACGEEDLRSQTGGAIDFGELIRFRSCRSIIVQACIADGLGFECTGEAASEGVTSHHTKSFWKRLEFLPGIATLAT
jgi:hypothetical protein